MIADVSPIQAGESARFPRPSRGRDRFGPRQRRNSSKLRKAPSRAEPPSLEGRSKARNGRLEARSIARTQPESSCPPRGIDTGDYVLGLYLRDVGAAAASEPAELPPAHGQAQLDNLARQRLVLSQLHRVVRIAFDHQKLGLPLGDLVNEGNLRARPLSKTNPLPLHWFLPPEKMARELVRVARSPESIDH